MVYYDVLRFNISMHYASTVAKIKGLQQLVQIESYLHIVHVGNQGPEINII